MVVFAREGLDDAHARDALRQGGRDSREPLPNAAVGARGPAPEDRGRDAQEREDGEGRQCEPPVEEEEDDHRTEEHQRVLEEARDTVRDELVERLDVVRKAGDDGPGAVSLVVAERESLEMGEEPLSKVGQDPLPDPAREVRLRHAREPVQEPGEEECRHDPPEDLDVRFPIPSSMASFARRGGASAVAVAASSETIASEVRAR